MITILAEKPSVAREIARIAGATRKEEGFYTGNGYHVTWALGHLVQPALPEGYGFKIQQGQPAGDTGGVHADTPPGKDGQGLQGGRGSGETDKGDNETVERERRHNSGNGLRTRRGTDIQIPVCLYGLYAALPPPVDKLAYGYRHPQGIEGTEGRA